MVSQKSKKEKDKALAKILDSSNIQSRIKALKACLETLPWDEMKRYLCENSYAYYYVWYDFYTLHVEPALRASLGKGLSKDVRDDLDTLLFVIERLIHLMPEKLASGWHCNSLSAFLRRLVTIQCTVRYRHIGVKIFLAWFQIVRQKAPAEMVFLFSTLVPGLDQTKLPNDIMPNSIPNVVLCPNSTSQTVWITLMNSSSRGHLDALVPASAQEQAAVTSDSEALKLMDNILNHLIANVSCTCWTDSRGKIEAFEFMLNQFRQKYLFKIFQEYNHKMDLYSDNKVCENVNYIREERDLIVKMKVLVIRWIMRIIPAQRSEAAEWTSQSKGGATVAAASSGPAVRNLMSPSPHPQSSAAAAGFSSSGEDHASVVPGQQMQQQHQSNSGASGGLEAAYQVAYQVLTASRDNINMCLEILRQGLLLPLGYSDVTLSVINLLNSWLNLKEVERPIFVQNSLLQDQLDGSELQQMGAAACSENNSRNLRQKLSTLAQMNLSESLDESQLRSMGTGGVRSACAKSSSSRRVSEVGAGAEMSLSCSDLLYEDALRVGSQNYLQYFFRSLSAIFYVEPPNAQNDMEVKKLNEIRYRVVTVFRQVAVTSGRRDFPQIHTPSTWHHLINILLHATTFLFTHNRHKAQYNQHFISNLINSLLVSCIMSNLFARMSTSIWDDVTQLLSSVVQYSPMVVDQWAKTTNFITVKILSPNVYNIDYSTLEQTDKGSLASGDSKRFSKGRGGSANERQLKQSSNRMKPPHPSVTKHSSPQVGTAYPKDPIVAANAPLQKKSIENPPFLGESLTTQALNQMLHGSQTALEPTAVRPSSLLLAERRDLLHKSKFKKPGQNMAACSLYASKSENCLLYASLTDDVLMRGGGGGGPHKHEGGGGGGDSDSCDAATETETTAANVLFEEGRVVEGYDSDNEGSVMGRRPRRGTEAAGTCSGLDQSYNTESLTSELLVSVSDAGSVKFDPEGSVASHDTQMSWLHNVAAAAAAAPVDSSPIGMPPQTEMVCLGDKEARAQWGAEQQKMEVKQTLSSSQNDDQRRCLPHDFKPRPNSDVAVPKSSRPSGDWRSDAKSRNSWAGENRKCESCAVKFVEDSGKNGGQSPDRMATADSGSSSVAGGLTSGGPDSDLDVPVFHQDQSPNIEGELVKEALVSAEKQLLTSSGDASEICSYGGGYPNEQDISSNVLTVDPHSPSSSSPRNSSYVTSWALTSENRSIITGGEITGWTRESAFVVWRRIVGIIGNVNDIKDADTYTNVMKHLMQMHDTLQKIAENQSFVDEDGLFQLPAYVPPVAIFLPWAIAGCRKMQDVARESPICEGILLAHKLAAQIVLEYPAINKATVTSFFQILYENLKLNRMELKQLLVEEMFKLYSTNLSGSMVLLKIMTQCACDVIDANAAPSSTISTDLSYPHFEVKRECIEKAVVLLGSLVCFPEHYKRDWKCVELKEGHSQRGETHACMFPMASLAQSISTRLASVVSDESIFTNIAASCYALSALCVICVCEAAGAEDSSQQWYSFNESIAHLANPLKFNYDVVAPTWMGSAPPPPSCLRRRLRHVTREEVNVAQLSTHYIHCIFDVLLLQQGGGDRPNELVHKFSLKSIIHTLLHACNTAVTSFVPDNNLLTLLVSLMLTLQDCVCKTPIEILAEETAAADTDDINTTSTLSGGDIPMQITLSESVHRCLKNIQEHCRSWMAEFLSQETESMQESSEHSTEHDLNVVNVNVSPSPKDKLTSSSSSSSNLSSTTKAENSNSCPKYGPSAAPLSPNNTSINRDGIDVVNKLWHATDLVSNVILCLMGRYPDWEGGVTKLDSAVTEADNNAAAACSGSGGGGGELCQALINNDYSQVFVHNENTIISVLELPQTNQMASEEDNGTGRGANNKIVRFILRDLSGKYCYDFIPTNEQNEQQNEDYSFEKDTSDSLNDTTLPCEDNVNLEASLLQSDVESESGSGSGIEQRVAKTGEQKDCGGQSETIEEEVGGVGSDGHALTSSSSVDASESGVEQLITSHNLQHLQDSPLLKDSSSQNGGGSSSSTSSTADGTADTEHGDQASTGTYEILEYLESATHKPERIPNALNEILEYLSTSEDLLDYPGQRLDSPARPCGFVERYQEEIKEMEKEMIDISQKEIDMGLNETNEKTAAAVAHSSSSSTGVSSFHFTNKIQKEEERPFAAAARLLMQLNCFSWNNRKTLFLLNKSAALIKELKHLDTQSLRETHKFAVIYVANGQETKASILSNQGGSKEYEVFLSGLGWEVDVETHKGYLGLMPSNGSICKTTPYYASPTCEVVYHVATKMAPRGGGGGLNQKWRHIGNDHVHIVWNEHCRPYRSTVMPTQFADVIIVLSPLPNKLIHVNISCKPPMEPHLIGPLFDGAIIDFAILPMLVRVTAIRANNLLKQNKQGPIFFESRQKTIESIVKRFKLMQIYEDFVMQSVNPQFKSSVISPSLRSSSHLIGQELNVAAATVASVPPAVPTRTAPQRLEALFSGGPASLFEHKAKTKPLNSSNFSTVHLPTASRLQPHPTSSNTATTAVPPFSKTHSGALSKPPIVVSSPSSNDSPTIFRMPWRSKSLSISSGEDCSES